jgi:hypothetical protein
MKRCPYCGYSNYDGAAECRKCQASFLSQAAPPPTEYKPKWFGPERAHSWRSRALSVLVLGLLIKVYWGGYGPWPVVDNPALAHLRSWIEPLLIFGGIFFYLVGWVLNWI